MTNFFIYFYSGGLLVSTLYGSSFLLPIYMKMLNGSEMNMGIFLLCMGMGALYSVNWLNKILLNYVSPARVIQIGTIAYSVGMFVLSYITKIEYIYFLGFM